MRIEYKLVNGVLQRVRPGMGDVVVYAAPTEAEKAQVLDTLPIEEHTLESMLDPDEISRIELEDDCNVIIWKRATPEPQASRFPVSSIGLVLGPGNLTVIEAEATPLPFDMAHSRPQTLNELLLRGMQRSVAEFFQRIKEIKETSRIIQSRLTKTLDNRELLRMFDLSERLVFVVDAIDANAVVLRRLAAQANRLGLTEREVDLLDEITIDNAQISRQGHIFITIFAGLMDARGNIVNNNMNVLLKNLTVVNVIFLPLGVIAGMGGMSEFTMMTGYYGIPWQAGYIGFALALIVLGVIIAIGLRLWVTRLMESDRLNGRA